MARQTPIQPLHDQAGAMMLPYGPDAQVSSGAPADSESQLPSGSTATFAPPSAPIEIVGIYGELELEYAAIRKGCLLLDLPNRAVLEVTGAERLEFLNRMITQELKPAKKWLDPFVSVSSFWLNRKGRIDADLRVLILPDRVLLECDAHAAKRALDGLNAFIISEDAAMRDLSETTHRLALHGPTALQLLAAISTPVAGPDLASLEPNRSTIIRIGEAEVIIDRRDQTGERGIDLIVPTEHARAIYELLLTRGFPHEHVHERGHPHLSTELSAQIRLRPGGWHAFNIARIEGGTPLYYIDFGPSSLPAETGIIETRVSFTKGCYLGQEVVARMHSRGHSKRKLVALLAEAQTLHHRPGAAQAEDPYLAGMPQPISGAQVLPLDPQSTESLGVITSSTLSPMNAATPLCFAAIKQDAATPNAKFRVQAESETLTMTAQLTLQTHNSRA
ncbi:MAG: aminomethyltransferase family protein [Planctomycetes bacterium]|nr:aminomethyltransferase family protein [Planctomycetota bacterium]